MIPDASWRFHSDRYDTPERPAGWLAQTFPSALFYPQMVGIVLRSSRLAPPGALRQVRVGPFQRSGGRVPGSVRLPVFHVEGLAHLDPLDQPCVLIGNHMSTLETFALPSIILDGP